MRKSKLTGPGAGGGTVDVISINGPKEPVSLNIYRKSSFPPLGQSVDGQ